jgi:hypothetical protein
VRSQRSLASASFFAQHLLAPKRISFSLRYPFVFLVAAYEHMTLHAERRVDLELSYVCVRIATIIHPCSQL